MKINSVSNNIAPIKTMTFRLSDKTMKMIEKSTRLTEKEMKTLSDSECRKLMIERGTLKEPSKLKVWASNLYKKFGEKLGLLEKQYNIYTDIH